MARGVSPCHALEGDDAPLGDQSAEARRMAANFAKLLELLLAPDAAALGKDPRRSGPSATSNEFSMRIENSKRG